MLHWNALSLSSSEHKRLTRARRQNAHDTTLFPPNTTEKKAILMFTTTLLSSSSSSPFASSVVQPAKADKRVLLKSMKSQHNTIIPGKKCRVITHQATLASSHDDTEDNKALSTRRESVMMMMVFGSSVAWALPSLAFGISSDAKADLAASRDAKKAAILAAARAKAEGQAANVVSSSQEQDGAEEATTTKASTTAFQPASFSDASKSGAGVRGGGPDAGNTYEVTKQATPAPAATPEPSAAPAAAPEPSSDDGDGGFGLPSVSLPSVSLPSLPKLPF